MEKVKMISTYLKNVANFRKNDDKNIANRNIICMLYVNCTSKMYFLWINS